MIIGAAAWKRLIREGAEALGVSVSAGQADQFAAHAEHLMVWNRKINLTRITDPVETAVKHYIDCLPPVRRLSAGSTLLDIGAGGGFPGVPLKIMLPSLSVRLIDAAQKKTHFLKHVIRALGLTDIDVRRIRSDELGRDPNEKGRYQAVTGRAVTDLTSFVETAAPLTAPGGVIIALKGKDAQAELTALRRRLPELEKQDPRKWRNCRVETTAYALPVLGDERSMVAVTLSN